MMKKNICLLCLFIINISMIFSESKGEKLFKENNPQEASVILESELRTGKNSATAYNYLGLSYYQMGEYEKSIEIFAKGLKEPGTNKKILAFNQGNSYFALKEYASAVDCYSLAIKMDAEFDVAYLNRANALLMDSQYENSIVAYESYLELKPEDSQKEKILDLIATIRSKIEKMAEEERILQEELARMAIENTPIWEQVVFDDEENFFVEESELPVVSEIVTDDGNFDLITDKNNGKKWEEFDGKLEYVPEKQELVEEKRAKDVDMNIKVPEWEAFTDNHMTELSSEEYSQVEINEEKEQIKWELISDDEIQEIFLLDESDAKKVY